MSKKMRADLLLLERGLAPSRSKAQAIIMAGQAFANEQRIEKPGQQLPPDVALRVAQRSRYVSRGGDKLAGALHDLTVVTSDKVCVDVGASTGGFCDCLLQHGARHVYAVDVGYGQLHNKLRNDPRVTVRERTNARHLQRDDFDHAIELVVVDASFIGLDRLTPAIARVLPADGELLALIKPQFEVGKHHAARTKGVVRDPVLRQQAIDKATAAVSAAGFEVIASADCQLAGPKGNREHFVHARRRADC